VLYLYALDVHIRDRPIDNIFGNRYRYLKSNIGQYYRASPIIVKFEFAYRPINIGGPPIYRLVSSPYYPITQKRNGVKCMKILLTTGKDRRASHCNKYRLLLSFSYIYYSIIRGVYCYHSTVVHKESNFIIWIACHTQFLHLNFNPFHTCCS